MSKSAFSGYSLSDEMVRSPDGEAHDAPGASARLASGLARAPAAESSATLTKEEDMIVKRNV